MAAFRVARHVAALAVAVVVAGCAGIETPTLDPALPSHWRHANAAGAAAADLHGWWHAFHDPQLDALVDDALRHNLDVAQAREHLLAARALAQGEHARYRPYVRGKTEDAIDPDASASFFVAGFDAVWELPLFGRGKASHEQAQGALDEGVAGLQSARVSLVAEVVRQWLQLRAAVQSGPACDAIRDARAQQLRLERMREHLRLASPAVVARAEAALAQATAAAAEPGARADAHAQGLAVLLGRNAPDPHWLAPTPVPDLGALELTSTPADMLRSRPEIALAQADVLSALGDARMARADLYPSIGIGGSIVWSTNLTTHRRTNDNAIASAGPILEIPLFDWGLRESQLDARNHALKAAVFAYRQAVLDGVAAVENALGELAQARVQERSAEQAAQAFERALAATDTRVKLQLDSPLTRDEDAAASAQARLDAIQAKAAHGLAFVRLYKALGGAPLPPAAELR